MNLTTKCSPSRCADFLNIAEHSGPTKSGRDADLFIGEKSHITMVLAAGTQTRFRDVVVLGKLTLIAKSVGEMVKPTFAARDIFGTASNIKFKNVSIFCQNSIRFEDAEKFRESTEKTFLDWLSFQRESVQRMGLKSILI